MSSFHFHHPLHSTPLYLFNESCLSCRIVPCPSPSQVTFQEFMFTETSRWSPVRLPQYERNSALRITSWQPNALCCDKDLSTTRESNCNLLGIEKCLFSGSVFTNKIICQKTSSADKKTFYERSFSLRFVEHEGNLDFHSFIKWHSQIHKTRIERSTFLCLLVWDIFYLEMYNNQQINAYDKKSNLLQGLHGNKSNWWP